MTSFGNQAGRDVGGLFASASSLNFVIGKIAGNRSGNDGGGMHVAAGDWTLANSVPSGNLADGEGGTLYARGPATTDLDNVTLARMVRKPDRCPNWADLELGKLGATSILPNPDLFVFMYVRREASESDCRNGMKSVAECAQGATVDDQT